jgi:UDPglucose 6-dehydrogenase
MANDLGVEPTLLSSVDAVNERQKQVLIEKLANHFGGKLAGKMIAIWGLAFKPRTDDIREAPALVLIDWLLEQGAKVRVHDPEAMPNVQRIFGDKLVYSPFQMSALDGADALAIMTEWRDYHRPDFTEMKQNLKSPTIFDGRNLYDPERMQQAGFRYYSIGRPVV